MADETQVDEQFLGDALRSYRCPHPRYDKESGGDECCCSSHEYRVRLEPVLEVLAGVLANVNGGDLSPVRDDELIGEAISTIERLTEELEH